MCDLCKLRDTNLTAPLAPGEIEIAIARVSAWRIRRRGWQAFALALLTLVPAIVEAVPMEVRIPASLVSLTLFFYATQRFLVAGSITDAIADWRKGDLT